MSSAAGIFQREWRLYRKIVDPIIAATARFTGDFAAF
jgi:hypothetical protein